tara:strand:- start:3939 stop:4121 length:183 start_codon:yes stop_codon:yes gene_type:complete
MCESKENPLKGLCKVVESGNRGKFRKPKTSIAVSILIIGVIVGILILFGWALCIGLHPHS